MTTFAAASALPAFRSDLIPTLDVVVLRIPYGESGDDTYPSELVNPNLRHPDLHHSKCTPGASLGRASPQDAAFRGFARWSLYPSFRSGRSLTGIRRHEEQALVEDDLPYLQAANPLGRVLIWQASTSW